MEISTPEGFKNVTQEEFHDHLDPLDVLPYPSRNIDENWIEWRTPSGDVKAKSISYYPKEHKPLQMAWYDWKTKYYIPKEN